MAITPLRTNFKNDILDPSMDGKRHYNLIENSDGTVSLEDVSIYAQVGDDYGDSEINTANGTINELITGFSGLENGTTTVKKAETADKAKVAESVENDLVLVNEQALIFTNKICSIQDERITANSLADVYFTADSINVAENAVISVETYNGEVELTAGREPEGTIRASIHIRVVK